MLDAGIGVSENIENGEPIHYIVADAYVDVQFGAIGMAIGMVVGSVIPGAGTMAGAAVGLLVGTVVNKAYDIITEEVKVFDGKSLKDVAKEAARKVADFLKWW